MLLGTALFAISEAMPEDIDVVKEAEKVEAAEQTMRIYLKPGVWTSDGAWFWIHAYNSSSSKDYAMIKDNFNTDYYYVDIPTSYTSANFVRANPNNKTAGNWNNKWNQTNDIKTLSTYNVYLITGWSETSYTYQQTTYTVNYHGNGITGGSTTKSSHKYSISENLTSNGFIRTGYTFDGWNTAADGTGTDYTDEALVTNLTTHINGTIDLYAQWEVNKYFVKFNANKPGTASTSISGTMANQSFKYDESSKPLTSNGYTLSGYTFTGWNTKEDGSGTSYADGKSVQNLTSEANEIVNLYAQWETKKCEVILSAGDGIVNNGTTSVTATFDSNMPSITIPTRTDGYTFAGYYDPNTNECYYTATGASAKKWDVDTEEDVTLVAEWVEPVYIYFDLNYASIDITGNPFDSNIPEIKNYIYGVNATQLQYLYAKQDTESQPIEAPDASFVPINTNYKFVGWTDKDGNVITNYTYSKDNKTYYAKWINAVNFNTAELLIDYYYYESKDSTPENRKFDLNILSVGIKFSAYISDSNYINASNIYLLTITGVNNGTSETYTIDDGYIMTPIILLNITDHLKEYEAVLTITNSNSQTIYEQIINISIKDLVGEYLSSISNKTEEEYTENDKVITTLAQEIPASSKQ